MAFKEIYFSEDKINLQTEEMVRELLTDHSPVRKWNADLPHSALLVTDMQNYFTDPSSHAYIPSVRAVIPQILSLIRTFKDLKLPVLYTRHVNTPSDAGSMSRWWNDLIPGTSEKADTCKELQELADDTITKTQYDAFYKTDLDGILISRGVKSLVITGVMTNLCCETTLRSAFVRGYDSILPVDATATYNRSLHMNTFRNLVFGFCPLMTTSQVIEIIES